MTEVRQPWSQGTRNAWFLGLLALSTAALVYLFSPFLNPLLFAAVVVVVSWPLYQRVLRMCGRRRAVASVLTTLLLAVLIFGPLGTVLYLFAAEAVAVAQSGAVWVQSPEFEAFVRNLQDIEETWAWEQVAGWLPEDFDPVGALVEAIQSAALVALNGLGAAVPAIIGKTVSLSIEVAVFLAVFVFAVITLFMEGPRVVQAIMHLSPMDDAYEERLFKVFAEFANNMVFGSLTTALVQGLVASIGYLIAGVDRVIFMAILTAVFSFIPVVGTAAIWLPLAIYAAATRGVGWGLFIAAWSILFTGTVDNVLKPILMRGSSNIHPLLIFLAVFGGIAWFGLPGVLLGPVIVAGFLALFTIYRRDFLGLEVVEPSGEPGWMDRLRARIAGDDEPPLAAALEPPPPAEVEAAPTEAAAPAAPEEPKI